jgi:acetamidase/formamidase
VKRATKDILYFETGPDNPVTLRVMPGEMFEVETQLNKGPWLDEHPDGDALLDKLCDGQQPRETMFDSGWSVRSYLAAGLPSGNPSSGCIYVEGARPGDVLLVHIDEIDLDPLGYTAFAGNNSSLPGWMGPSGVGAGHRVVEIRDGVIHWDEGLELPTTPMLGCIGVAPARERINNSWAGYWGGNFDTQEVTTGATLMLGVNVEGALLHIGDMHAIQGDGEICGAGGIEASGRVRLTVELAPRPKSFFWPRLVNATHIATLAMARPCEDAFRYALEALILWMEEDYGYSRTEAYLLLGQILEARCTAFVNPTFTYITKAPKQYLTHSK